jgi:hypothetical protein
MSPPSMIDRDDRYQDMFGVVKKSFRPILKSQLELFPSGQDEFSTGIA